MGTLKAFHNDPAIKAKYLANAWAARDARAAFYIRLSDEIIRIIETSPR